MLLAALGATVIGFVLLIVALITGNLWLAIACVVVSVVGVALLLGDVLTYRRGERDKSDADAAWSPGDRTRGARETDTAESASPRGEKKSTGTGAVAAGAGAVAGASVAGASESADDDAAREAGTVGHEEFGRHDTPDDDDARPTTEFARGPLGGPSGWDHEGPADTDDESTRGLFAPGTYDPDMTDQIPQVEVDRAWGSQWSAPEDPDQK